jgi:Cyclic nucleotide-binding domain/Peptidase C39 family
LPLRRAFDRLAEVRDNIKNWLRLHALVSHLRHEPFLGFLSGPSVMRLLERAPSLTFAAGKTIQADGLCADRWFFVESGRVRLTSEEQGAETLSRELGPGECFGERALAGWGGLATATAAEEVRCLALRRADFWPAGPPSFQSLAVAGRPFPWVGQQEATDCGVAALAMVARCHGVAVSVERLCSLVRLGEKGATLLDLQRAAEALGLPAIAHMIDGHYVVLYAVGPAGVVLGDPASGVVTVSLPLFRLACSGRLLLLSPGQSAAP